MIKLRFAEVVLSAHICMSKTEFSDRIIELQDEMKRFFNIVAQGNTATIFLYGDIGSFGDELKAGDVVRELKEAETLYRNIDIRINCNGGDVDSGIAIFNAIRNSQANIRMFVDGVAASMGSVIALCGKPIEMSKYARLMLHSIDGGCYGNKEVLANTIKEIEALENVLATIYSEKTGLSVEDIKATYFDGKDHWLTAEEALSLKLIDGIYDADPIAEPNPTPDQIYKIFNNRLKTPQNNNSNMNLDEIRKRPRFKDCATDEAVLQIIDDLEVEAAKVPGLTTELDNTKASLKTFQDKAKADEEAEKTTLLDAAEADGRINAETRPTFKALLDADRTNGENALKVLPVKKRIITNLANNGDAVVSAWDKRMDEIRTKNK